MLNKQTDAEELVMDLMLTLWNKRYTLELKGELLPYLFAAMRNAVISHARKKPLQLHHWKPSVENRPVCQEMPIIN